MKRVFFDIDGPLNVWETGVPIEEVTSPGYLVAREPHKHIVEAARLLYEAGVDVFIISAVFDPPHTIPEKDQWIDKYLPFIDKAHRLYPLCGEGKSEALKHAGFKDGDVLLDDYNVNLREVRVGLSNRVKCVKCVCPGTNDTRGTWDGDRVFVTENPENIAKKLNA